MAVKISGIWQHKRTKNDYFVIRQIKRRVTQFGPIPVKKWEEAVLYCEDVDDIDSTTWYERPTQDFLDSFVEVS